MNEMNVESAAEASQASFAPTGNGRIDDAMARLTRLDEVPVDSHPEIFDEIHAGLRDALANAGRDEDIPTESP